MPPILSHFCLPNNQLKHLMQKNKINTFCLSSLHRTVEVTSVKSVWKIKHKFDTWNMRNLCIRNIPAYHQQVMEICKSTLDPIVCALQHNKREYMHLQFIKDWQRKYIYFWICIIPLIWASIKLEVYAWQSELCNVAHTIPQMNSIFLPLHKAYVFGCFFF